MKKTLLNITILSISLLTSIGALKAQVVIFEQDGAQNEIDPSLWTITNDMGFSNATQISIGKSETGTLALYDTQVYKDVTVEIHLANGDPNTQFPIAFNGHNGGTMSQLITYKLNGGMNKMLFTFDSNSFTPIDLKEMVFTNTPSKVIKLSYIKITGFPVNNTTGINIENANAFDVRVNKESLIIHSGIEGTLNIYNSIGQIEGTCKLTKGENTIMNSTKGMLFLVLSNSNIESISRKKIMR